ncbi:MAG: glutamate-cysteine ligase family protein [Coriobacteriia bacterium]|nr:glutamate-cysteine ligase family protein [Coriobacteriia bacterium]
MSNPLTNEAIYRQNLASIIACLQRGCKDEQLLGVEFENILVKSGSFEPVTYSEPNGVLEVLRRLSAHYDSLLTEDGHVLGLASDTCEERVTLEPGAFVEYSSAPLQTVGQVEQAFRKFRKQLLPILDDLDLSLAELGYHPSARSRNMELIPKKRYLAMDRYLTMFGRFGSCMMRCAAALQVNIDYSSEADAVRKIRIATGLAPLLALLTDNSPIFEGRRTKQHMARTMVWANYDATRVTVVPGTFDDDFGFRRYAEYVYNMESIIVPNGADWRYSGEETFAEAYADTPMTNDDVMHALTMVFPDARLKGVLEIRPADALPLPYALAYVALIKGLFYSETSLTVLEEELAGLTENSVEQAKRLLVRDGFAADLSKLEGYGTASRTPREWLVHLFDLASCGLDDSESIYLQPLLGVAERGQTLAQAYSGFVPSVRKIPRIGILPRYSMDHTAMQVGLGYINAVLEAGGIPMIIPSTDDPTLIQALVDEYDGFIVPGGHDIDPINYRSRRSEDIGDLCPERDIMELVMVPMIVDADKPLLGICRGHQVLNVSLGGTMIHDINKAFPDKLEHMQEPPYDHREHEVVFVEGSKLGALMGAKRLRVNTLHHQAIDKVAPELRVAAWSEDGLIEAVEAPDKRFVYGVQWHPEFLWPKDYTHRRLFRRLVQESMKS